MLATVRSGVRIILLRGRLCADMFQPASAIPQLSARTLPENRRLRSSHCPDGLSDPRMLASSGCVLSGFTGDVSPLGPLRYHAEGQRRSIGRGWAEQLSSGGRLYATIFQMASADPVLLQSFLGFNLNYLNYSILYSYLSSSCFESA